MKRSLLIILATAVLIIPFLLYGPPVAQPKPLQESRDRADDSHQQGRQDQPPSVAWTPDSVVFTLAPGESKTTRVTARLKNLTSSSTIRLDPTLTRYISVTPSRLPAYPHGSDRVFDLSIQVPANVQPGTLAGTLQVFLRADDERHADSSALRDDLDRQPRAASEGRESTKDRRAIPQTLPITLNIWQQLQATGIPLSVNYPPSWVVRQVPGAITLSNVQQPAPLSDAALQTQTFFRLELLTRDPGIIEPSQANPDALPIDQWFDRYFAQGFSVEPQSRTSFVLNGHQAIRVEIVEVGGLRAHVYIANGSDVIEVEYGLFTPQFVPLYETMLRSIVFTN